MPTISERKSINGTKYQAKVRKLGYPTYSRTFDTRKEALAWGIDKEASIEAGQEQRREYEEVLSVEALLNLYKMETGKSNLHIAGLRRSTLWDMPISEIQPEDVLKFSHEPNEATDTLQTAIEYAREELEIKLPRNPVIVAYAKPTQPRERRISETEEQTILDEASNTRGGYLRDTIILALDTALMQHEILSLDWSNVDLQRKVIELDGKLGARVIPITKRVVKMLISRSDDTQGLVFDGVSSMALQRSFIRTVERAGIDDLHFNDLRYEALCRMLANGLSPQQIWNIVGSKTLHPLTRILNASDSI